MLPLNKCFDYPALERVTAEDGTRHYTCPVTHSPLPSVTTILSATADKTGLLMWEEFVGKKKADRVREEALALGTLMHTHLENYIQGVDRPRGNNLIRQMAERMANRIIERGLPAVNEVWGMEVAMYFPGVYAGTTDLVGLHDGVPAIMDHKTAKKLRTWEQVSDYGDQLGAYALAHNEVYGTNIRKGVIFMVDRELGFQKFEVEGIQLERHKDNFLRRLDTYLTKAAAA